MHCLNWSFPNRVKNMGKFLLNRISSMPVAHLLSRIMKIGPVVGAHPRKASGSGEICTDLQPFLCILSPVRRSSVVDLYIHPTWSPLPTNNWNYYYFQVEEITLSRTIRLVCSVPISTPISMSSGRDHRWLVVYENIMFCYSRCHILWYAGQVILDYLKNIMV